MKMDVEMLEIAGITYTMENADNSYLKQALTPANNQGGIIKSWKLVRKKEWSSSTVIRKLVTKTKIKINHHHLNQVSVVGRRYFWSVPFDIITLGAIWDIKTIINQLRGYQAGIAEEPRAHLRWVMNRVLLVGQVMSERCACEWNLNLKYLDLYTLSLWNKIAFYFASQWGRYKQWSISIRQKFRTESNLKTCFCLYAGRFVQFLCLIDRRSSKEYTMMIALVSLDQILTISQRLSLWLINFFFILD